MDQYPNCQHICESIVSAKKNAIQFKWDKSMCKSGVLFPLDIGMRGNRQAWMSRHGVDK